MALSIQLFGAFQATWDERPLTFATDHTRALLAHLVVETKVAHQRTTLATLLWPEESETRARHNLRQALLFLKRALAPVNDRDLLLHVTPTTIQWHNHNVVVDLLAFQQCWRFSQTHSHANLQQCATCIEQYAQAMVLYRSEFLQGLLLKDNHPFEEWALVLREQSHRYAMAMLSTLSAHHAARGAYESVQQYAAHQVALEPWHEEAHRQLMVSLVAQGQEAAALRHYESCRRTLQQELGVPPSPETSMLYQQIRNGNLGAAITSDREIKSAAGTQHHVLPTPAIHDWGEMPAVDLFEGRAAELTQLAAWLVPQPGAGRQRARLISLLGIGGVGKTTLAATVTNRVAANFTVVLWRTLLNAPPLDEVLRGWLQILSHQRLTEIPIALDQQLRILVEYLRQQPCLLVLDNLESILRGAQEGGQEGGQRAGEMRPGYEGYAELLHRIATVEHQSCLLLTSREQPYVLLHHAQQLHNPVGRVRWLTVAGLDQEAGQMLLAVHGLHASPPEAARLVQHYSGNPLALQIVATTIADFFGGDIAAFHQAEGLLFDGVSDVLDQQLVRLAPLEQEILLWLAIEREAVTVQTLRSNLIPKPSMTAILRALQALQARSLLERSVGGLSLQNVIIEYCTERLVEQLCQAIEQVESDGLSVLDSALNRYALRKTQAKEYVRQSQVRLILHPVSERLRKNLSEPRLAARIQQILTSVRQAGVARSGTVPGYAAGNLLNLLLHLKIEISGYDFSQLCVWQADLRRCTRAAIDFSGADLAHSAFTLAIDLQAVKFMNSGELLLGGVIDGDLYLWRAVDGQLDRALHRTSNGIYPMTFSPSGQRVTGAGPDYVVRVWDTTTGEQLHELRGHQSRVYSLAISHDHQMLASGTGEQPIYLWHLTNNQLHLLLDGHADGAGALAFRPDSAVLASGGTDQLVRLWDTKSGQLLATLAGHQRALQSLAFSPDGQLLASGAEDCTIRVWDVSPYQPGAPATWTEPAHPLHTLHGHTQMIRALAFHPNGTMLASASADHAARLWDLPTGRLLYTLLGHEHEVNGLSFNPDGTILVSSSVDQKAFLWETLTGRALDTLNVYQYTVHCVRFSPDGQMIASSGSDSLIHLWDVQSGALFATLVGHTQLVHDLAFSPDGQYLASAGWDQSVRLWDLRSRTTVQQFIGHTNTVTAVAFSRDGAWLASGGTDRTIRLWAMPDGPQQRTTPRQIQLVGHEAEITALAFSPDGDTLVSGSQDHTLRLWSIKQGQAVGILRGHRSGVTAIAINPPGDLVASSSFDNTVRLWDATSGQPAMGGSGLRVGGHFVAFQPNGPLFAYSTLDFAIIVVHRENDQVLHCLRGHKNLIQSLDFNPSAPHLVSCSWDGEIRLWDLETGDGIRALHTPPPYSGMKIAGVTGISAAQKAALRKLGAVEQ